MRVLVVPQQFGAEVVACRYVVRIMVVLQQFGAEVVADIPLCCAYYGCTTAVRRRGSGMSQCCAYYGCTTAVRRRGSGGHTAMLCVLWLYYSSSAEVVACLYMLSVLWL